MSLRDLFKRKPKATSTSTGVGGVTVTQTFDRTTINVTEINDLSRKLFASHIPGWNGSKGQQRLRKAVGLE